MSTTTELTQLRQRVADLERQLAKVPIRPAIGGSGNVTTFGETAQNVTDANTASSGGSAETASRSNHSHCVTWLKIEEMGESGVDALYGYLNSAWVNLSHFEAPE